MRFQNVLRQVLRSTFNSDRGYELTDAGLVAKRPAGNTYTISDDRDILEFYYNHQR